MLLSERMALRTAISHYQHNVSQVLEMSSSPWKCFVNRAELKRLNVLLGRDAEIIIKSLPGLRYDELCHQAGELSSDPAY